MKLALALVLLASLPQAQAVTRGGPPTGSAVRGATACPPEPSPPPLLHQVLGQGQGGFGGTLAAGDGFGHDVQSLGDFNGDCVPDLVVTAPLEPNGGALWLLYLRRDGTVLDQRKISTSTGGFTGALQGEEAFRSVASLGDLDRDGTTDLLVGAPSLAYPPWEEPASSCWVLFMNPDGTVKGHRELVESAAGMQRGTFGHAVACVGDLDSDGVPDVAVSELFSIWIYLLNRDGSVKAERHVFPGSNGFPLVEDLDVPEFAVLSSFGIDLEPLGDFDGDGVEDLLIASDCFQFEGQNGHLALTFLNADGSVKSIVDHSSVTLGIYPFEDQPDAWYADGRFGEGTAVLGDLDGNGAVDLAVGSPDPHGCYTTPSVWILRLNTDGSVAAIDEITGGSAPYHLALEPSEFLGAGIASAGDVNGDGRVDLAVGAPQTFAYSPCPPLRPEGAVYVLGDVASVLSP